MVWSVLDCWLSAHLPNLDPSPTAPSEAQITLSNLLGQHTRTTHYYCCKRIGNMHTRIQERENKREKREQRVEDRSRRQKTRDRKGLEKSVLLKHLHIKCRKQWSGWGRGSGQGMWDDTDRQVKPTCCVFWWMEHRVSKYTWATPSSSFSCLSTAWHGWMGGFSLCL